MKISMESIKKWNAKMGQGFTTDINHLVTWNEKRPHLVVDIEGSDAQVEICLAYYDEYERITNEYGCSYNRPTGRYIPTAHVQKWRPTGSGMMQSFGLGKTVNIGEPCEKRMFSKLQNLTHTVDVKQLVKLGLDEPNTLEESKPII